MPISFTCPACGQSTVVADEFAGRTGPCRNCGYTITIPLGNAQYGSGQYGSGQYGSGQYGNAMSRPAYAPRAASRGASSGGVSSGIVIAIIAGVVGVGFVVGVGVVVVALVLPAFQSAQHAAQRSHSQNNLKQIAIAFHNYHDVYNCFPPAYQLDANGNKTRSWRVTLLPFLNHKPLGDRYQSDQPWDSPANQAISNTVIPVYKNAADTKGAPTDTSYMVVTGPGTLFDGDKRASFARITDGSSNTILAVEVVGSGVKWAEPKDLDINTMVMKINGGGANSLGSPFGNGANVVMADGAVRFLSNDTLESTLRAMITASGGEVIP